MLWHKSVCIVSREYLSVTMRISHGEHNSKHVFVLLLVIPYYLVSILKLKMDNIITGGFHYKFDDTDLQN